MFPFQVNRFQYTPQTFDERPKNRSAYFGILSCGYSHHLLWNPPSWILLPPSSTLTRNGYFTTTPFLPNSVTSTPETLIDHPPEAHCGSSNPKIRCGTSRNVLREPSVASAPEHTAEAQGNTMWVLGNKLRGSSPSLMKSMWSQKRVERRGDKHV